MRIRGRWDDLNNRWNLFVLGYDREKQRDVLASLGFENAGYRTLVVLLVVSLAIVMAALALSSEKAPRSVLRLQ